MTTNLKKALATLLAVALSCLTTPSPAQSLQLVPNPPHLGTYYSMAFATNWPPLPMLPFDVPVYLLSNDPTNGPVFLYDDTSVDYDALNAMTSRTVMAPLSATPDGPSPRYGSNDFFLTILFDTNATNSVDVILNNTQPTLYYQLLTNTAITTPLAWGFGTILYPDPSTNAYWYHTPYIESNGVPADQFFRAVSGVAIASVTLGSYASPIIGEPPADLSTSYFTINVLPQNSTGLNVVYQLSGSAANGLDYTNIPTSIYIPAGVTSANVWIQATNDNKIDLGEQAILSLVLTNGYIVDPSAQSASITITDNIPNLIQSVLTNLPVADLDWHSNTHSLIASAYSPDWNNGTNYFARISTYLTTNGGTVSTNVAITNWSQASGRSDEVRLTVVKTNTGFHLGDTFFTPEDKGTIGWISSDGLTWSNQWLTIGAESNAFRGDIYVDQTGLWGGDLLVVSGESHTLDSQNMNVWRINTNQQASLVASINTPHLEGLLTLPNNPAQYGPWAGKLLTADEGRSVFYAIETNGTVSRFYLDAAGHPIQPSAMRVIPRGENLYFSDPRSNSQLPPLILKIDQSYFTNYVGDILVTRAGESGHPAALFIVHWDNAQGRFVNYEIPYGSPYPPYYGEFIEHCTFAPIDLPAIPPE